MLAVDYGLLRPVPVRIRAGAFLCVWGRRVVVPRPAGTVVHRAPQPMDHYSYGKMPWPPRQNMGGRAGGSTGQDPTR